MGQAGSLHQLPNTARPLSPLWGHACRAAAMPRCAAPCPPAQGDARVGGWALVGAPGQHRLSQHPCEALGSQGEGFPLAGA